MGDHVLPEDVADDSDAEDDDEARPDSESDQPQSAVSAPQAQDLCEVSGSAARRTTCFCAMWAPAVLCILRGMHNWSNRLAVARYAALTSDTDMVLRLY